MSKIDKSRQITVFNDLSITPSSWNVSTQNLRFMPDEVRIRQISYNGANADGCFAIWSSLTSDIIGTFAVSSVTGGNSVSANIAPETVISLSPNTLPFNIQFTIQQLTLNSLNTNTSLSGKIMLVLDFIKYKE